jgi:hypothetical protein
MRIVGLVLPIAFLAVVGLGVARAFKYGGKRRLWCLFPVAALGAELPLTVLAGVLHSRGTMPPALWTIAATVSPLLLALLSSIALAGMFRPKQ